MALQDSDNLIIGRGTDSYKITYKNLKDDLNLLSDTEPNNPTHGDLWVDTSECPPVLKIYVDEAECPGEGGWQEIEGGGAPKPIDPSPDDGDNSITPKPPGTGTDTDPYILTAASVDAGDGTTSVETIAFSNGNPGDQVFFVDQNAAANGERFKQTAGIIQLDGTYSTKFNFSDTPKTDPDDKDYTGLLKIGSIYYSWTVSVQATVPEPIITQSPVISSTTEETDTPITVDTRAAVTNATFTSSAWLKDGVIIPGATSTTSYTPTEAGTYKFREVFTGDDGSTVNADSNELEITIDQTKPSATMSGLRFDRSRSTYLTKTFAADGNLKKWTWSGWIKNTTLSDSSGNNSWFGYQNNTDQSLIRMLNDGKIQFFNYEGGVHKGQLISTNSYNNLSWIHVVAVWDTAQATESNRMKLYINGEQSNSLSAYPSQNENSVGINKGGIPNSLGTLLPIENSADGYLSEVYFVDGEALEPTAFGKDFEGRWGPLDSSVVLENIKGKDKSPYEERPNMDEKWSDGADANWDLPYTDGNVYPASNLFDGDLTNGAFCGGANQGFITMNINVTEKLRFKGYGGPSIWTVTLDGQEVPVPFTTTGGAFLWVDVPGTGQLTRITNNNKGGGVSAIEVDGRLLVDQGVWNVSQNWSGDNVGFTPSAKASYAFNGIFDNSNAEYRAIAEGKGTTATVTFPEAITVNTSLRVYVGSGATQPKLLYINGNLVTGTTYPSGEGWMTIPGISSVSSIGIGRDSTGTYGDYTSLMGVEVDDAILVDAGAQWNTSQVWSNQLSIGSGTGSIDPATSGNGFDGDINTETYGTVNGDEPRWTPTTAIPSGTEIKVVLGTGTPNIAYGIVKDSTGELANSNGDSGNKSTLSFTAPRDIDYLQFAISDGGYGRFFLIEVDGEILVDAGTFGTNGFYLPFDPADGIGNDASGSNNHFQDENFVLESYTTIIPAANWTSKVTGPSRSGFEPANAFNGSISGTGWVPGINGTQVFTPNGATGLSFTRELAVWGYVDTGATGVLSVNGVDCTAKFAEGPQAGVIRKAVISDVAGVTSPLLNITSTSKGSASNALITAVEVDGAILIDNQDAIFQAFQDPVLDTPLKNYAVLQSGSNGNLVASANGTNLTYLGEAGTDYYYEANGTGAVHNGGSTFSSTTGVAYNFGQQPFEETPTAEGRLYQTWDEWARTTLGYAVDRIAKLEQRNLQLEALIEEARTRLASLELNEVSDDAVDTALITLIGNINDRLTTLEGGN